MVSIKRGTSSWSTSTPLVSIAPVTSNVNRVYSFEVEVAAGLGGLKSRSKIMINQTRAVEKARLIKKLGHLSAEILASVNAALKLHYDLEG